MEAMKAGHASGHSHAIVDYFSITVPLRGEAHSGDRSLVSMIDAGYLVAAVDGLGHGPEAAAATDKALATLEAHAHEQVQVLVQRCHDALRGTRGVVMSLASINSSSNVMTWLGIGNVEGYLWRAGHSSARAREELLLRGGIVGDQIPKLLPAILPVTAGDTLILATDGIRREFTRSVRMADSPREIAETICERYAKENDDALVIVARFKGSHS